MKEHHGKYGCLRLIPSNDAWKMMVCRKQNLPVILTRHSLHTWPARSIFNSFRPVVKITSSHRFPLRFLFSSPVVQRSTCLQRKYSESSLKRPMAMRKIKRKEWLWTTSSLWTNGYAHTGCAFQIRYMMCFLKELGCRSPTPTPTKKKHVKFTISPTMSLLNYEVGGVDVMYFPIQLSSGFMHVFK